LALVRQLLVVYANILKNMDVRVGTLPLLGRSRIFNSNDLKYFEVLLKEKVDWYLHELQSEMELWMRRNLSISTLWRTLHRLGYTHKKVS
jgi:transposase